MLRKQKSIKTIPVYCISLVSLNCNCIPEERPWKGLGGGGGVGVGVGGLYFARTKDEVVASLQ